MARITIPKDWDMFTSAGNKSIETKASRLVDNLEKGGDLAARLKHLKRFACGVTALGDTKTMSEAMDTDVRDHVSSFMRYRIAAAFKIPIDAVRAIEDECNV